MRGSNQAELVISYEPLEGIDESYEVSMSHSKREVHVDAVGNIDAPGGGYLVVTGKNHGGTNYHERFVFTPSDLHIVKSREATQVVLQKHGDRIDVVALR